MEDFDKTILFDSGGSQSKIDTLLCKKQITNIDVAICSHNDIDHSNGFIGLLNSKKIKIGELWLPGLWANILQFVIDNKEGSRVIWGSFFNYEKREDIAEYEQLFMPERDSTPIDYFDDQLSYISEIVDFQKWNHWRYSYYFKRTGFLSIKLDRILQIAGLAYQNGCKIRWFKPTHNNPCVKNMIDYGLVALNSTKICQVQHFKDTFSFLQALTLTEENEYSLVFEYLKNDIPVVRFSADSDCICQSVDSYQNNIIVTAPHHGSDANATVYNNLNGNDIIWIRSDRKSSKRPCGTFKGLKNKYCGACYSKNIKSEICFEYNDTKKCWCYCSGHSCSCS